MRKTGTLLVGLLLPLLGAFTFDNVAQADAGRTAVVVVHGGGWHGGSGAGVQPACDAITQGMDVDCFTPDYVLDTPYPAPDNDLVDYLEGLRAQGYTRIGAVGISAGGNLVAWLAYRGYVDVVITWSAPLNLNIPLQEWPQHLRSRIVAFAPTQLDRARASTTSIAVPALLINGRKETVPVTQVVSVRLTDPHSRVRILATRKHAWSYREVAIPITVEFLRQELG